MQLNPYLGFNGQCEAAFKFYEKVLGGKIETMMTYEGTPAAEQMPAEQRGKIVHASLSVGGQVLMGADAPPQYYEQPKGLSILINARDTAEAERIFNALAENGTVRMPMERTFFAARFGMLIDRFAIPWMVICEQSA